jgi:alpha-D-ribose 1-methylphosphonate 5-triphosphate synthase subunit PhnG
MFSNRTDSQFWAQFLPEVNKTIDKTLASVVAREEVLALLEKSAAEDFDSRFNEVKAKISRCESRPEESVAAVDALLQKTEEEYREKLADIEALRKTLADWINAQGTRNAA